MTRCPEGTKEGSRWQAAKRRGHRNSGKIQRAPAGAQERVLRPFRGRTFIAHQPGGRAASRLATGYLLKRLRRIRGVISIVIGAPCAVFRLRMERSCREPALRYRQHVSVDIQL